MPLSHVEKHAAPKLSFFDELENSALLSLVILLIIDFFSAYLLKRQWMFIRHMLDARIQTAHAYKDLIKIPEKPLISISALLEVSLGML